MLMLNVLTGLSEEQKSNRSNVVTVWSGLVNATWLGGTVAYASLMYSLFHIYGRTAKTR